MKKEIKKLGMRVAHRWVSLLDHRPKVRPAAYVALIGLALVCLMAALPSNHSQRTVSLLAAAPTPIIANLAP